MIPLWSLISILSILTYPHPSPALAEPVMYPAQQWNDSSVIGVANPVTQTSISAPKYPKQYKVAKRNQKPSSNACSCLKFATSEVGVHFGIAYARQMPTNATEPKKGAIIKTNENSIGTHSGHVGVVLDTTTDTVTIREANYYRCRITTRVIPKDSPIILGYFIVPTPQPNQ